MLLVVLSPGEIAHTASSVLLLLITSHVPPYLNLVMGTSFLCDDDILNIRIRVNFAEFSFYSTRWSRAVPD